MKANMSGITKCFITITSAFFIVAAVYQFAIADGGESGILSGKAVFDIEATFKNATAGWEVILKKYAARIFITLIGIEIVFLGIKSALSGTEKHEILKQFVMILLFGGFILAIINNHQDWSWNIIKFFRTISSELAPADVDTGKPFMTGLAMSLKILNMVSVWEPIDALAYIITAGIIAFCFALITAQGIYIECSAILSLFASMILLGFGGLSFTKEYAINAIKFVLSTAFRLFTLDLVLGAGITVINSFNISTNPTYEELFMVIGAALVLLTLVSRLPDEAASILNGSNISSGMALVQTAGAVGSVMAGAATMGAGLAAGAVNATKSVVNANKLANLEGKSGLGKAGSIAKSLLDSHQQAKAELPGQSTLKRMNSNMKEQIQARMFKQDVDGVGEKGKDSNGEQ